MGEQDAWVLLRWPRLFHVSIIYAYTSSRRYSLEQHVKCSKLYLLPWNLVKFGLYINECMYLTRCRVASIKGFVLMYHNLSSQHHSILYTTIHCCDALSSCSNAILCIHHTSSPTLQLQLHPAPPTHTQAPPSNHSYTALIWETGSNVTCMQQNVLKKKCSNVLHNHKLANKETTT